MPEFEGVRDYVSALIAAGVQRFDDEHRECRTVLIVIPGAAHPVKVDIPIAMIEADRVRGRERLRSKMEEVSRKRKPAKAG